VAVPIVGKNSSHLRNNNHTNTIMTCTISGVSDIYGLGVRIGLYLTGLACILARLFVPKQAKNLASMPYPFGWIVKWIVRRRAGSNR
jgi:hypothetical protein